MKKIVLSIVLAAFLLAAAPAINVGGSITQTQLLADGDGGDYDTGGG